MADQQGESNWAKSVLAFAIIYLVWGSTFLAIGIGVREVPPFLLAAMRFLVAGLVLYGWMIARGERLPSARQWMSVSVLAILDPHHRLLIWRPEYGRRPTGSKYGRQVYADLRWPDYQLISRWST